jgi:hypothetical protein
VPDVEVPALKPASTWAFAGPALTACLARSIVGWGYAMRLGWQVAEPQADTVTLVACYRPPGGKPTYSRPPIHVAVRQR